MASVASLITKEAATPATGDDLGVSTSSRDDFDGGYLYLIMR